MKKSLTSIVIATGLAAVAPTVFAYEAPADDPYWKRTTPAAAITAPAKPMQAMRDCATDAGPYHLVDDHNP
jgi:hypothetical protein